MVSEPAHAAVVQHLRLELDIVAYTCDFGTLEVEAGGFQVGSQPGLYGENLFQKRKI